jgi:uncharacterized membrane protein
MLESKHRIRFENTVTINRSVEAVYEFVANFQNIPKWNYYVTDVRKLSEGPIAVGTIYHQKRKVDEQRYQVTVFEPGKRVVVQTLPGESPAFTRDMRFETIKGETRIIDRWQLDLGQPALLQKLAQGKVKDAVRQNLGKLKHLLETGRVQLQDGRIVHSTA